MPPDADAPAAPPSSEPAKKTTGPRPSAGDGEYRAPEPGGELGGRYLIEDQLSPGPCGVVYRARDEQEGRDVIVRLLPPPLLKAVDARRLEARVAEVVEVTGKGVARLYGVEKDGAARYLVSEHLAGQRLSDLVAAKKRAGRAFTSAGAYNIVGHVLAALQTAHAAGLHHGDLRPENVFIDGKGRVMVADAGVAELLTPMRRSLDGPSAYDPPEQRADRRSDLRSAALLFSELCTGRPPVQGVSALPEAVGDVVRPWLVEEPDLRPDLDALGLREALQKGMQEAAKATREAKEREKEEAREEAAKKAAERAAEAAEVPETSGLRPAPPPLPVPTPSVPSEARLPSEVLFKDVLEKVGSGRRRGEERWLAHKDGLDFGPFCTEELIQRVRDDEFDEETAVQDLTTGMRRSLCDIPEFDKPLRRFLAERRARAQVEEAAHTARVKTAKKAGKGIFVTGTIGGLALVGGIVWVLAHKPLPKPIEYADVALTIGRALEAPALESPEAIAEQRYKKWRKKRKRARLRAMKAKDRKVVESFGDDGGGGGVTSLDFDEGDDGAPAGPKFSSSSVDRVLARAQPRFDKCLRKELKRNPKLGNVSLAFWVTPKGGTKGAQVKGRSTRLFGKCMVGVVGSLKFPKFSGTQRKISLPFQVTR